MCTVSYIRGGDRFILTHNRDEHFSRSPQRLQQIRIDGRKVLFPRDKAAGGTWIASSESGVVACILNGAFVKHKRTPPYRRSRGLLLLDYFETEDLLGFANQYDFKGIEPFTMIAVEEQQPFEIRWDAVDIHINILDDNETHFWSSATLYPTEIHRERQKFFRNWLMLRQHYGSADVLHMHYRGGIGQPEYDFVMNRNNEVQTVSVSQIVTKKNQIDWYYHDLISGNKERESLEINRLTN